MNLPQTNARAKAGALQLLVAVFASPFLVAAEGMALVQVKGNMRQLFERNDRVAFEPGKASPEGTVANSKWGRPEIQRMSVVAMIPAKDSAWRRASFTFTPRKSGTCEIVFTVAPPSLKENRWLLYDSIQVEGAELANADFEGGHGEGWTQAWLEFPGQVVEDPELAQAGSRFAVTWHGNSLAQYIEVSEGEEVMVSFWTRSLSAADFQAIRKNAKRHPVRGMARPPMPEGKRLKDIVAEEYPDGNVVIGVATGWDKMNGAEYHLVTRDFGHLAPYNFSQGAINPTPHEWKWGVPDQWTTFIARHGQTLRMHSPIGPQSERWSKTDSRTGEELDRKMTAFLTQLCRRYNADGNITHLEVINETLGPDGTWTEDRPGIVWETPWVKMGYTRAPAEFRHLHGGVIPTFIVKAFQIATKEAPNLKLVLNQHKGMEEPMWNAVKDMVRYLRSIGCRVDALGWQCHYKVGGGFRDWETSSFEMKDVSDLVAWSHANDLGFIITEGDIIMRDDDPAVLAEMEQDHETHFRIYGGLLKALLENRHTGMVGMDFWTIRDRDGHRTKKEVAIGLFDREGRPKPVYYEIQNLLMNPPELNQ